MIHAVVFDCFGVLATDGWSPFKQRYFGDDAAKMQQATDLNKAVDAGLADYNDFIVQVAALAGITPQTARAYIDNNQPNEPLFGLITELKKRYKIGLLSNAGDNWLSQIFMPAQVSQFDAVALSYETGVLKPDPRAYRIIAERLDVEPDECVLIDDQARYADGAEATGMHFITYESYDQTAADLKQLLG